MRYIDADKIVITAERGISADGLIFIPMIDVHRSIDATPTADVAEVRHGEWEAVVALNVSNNKYQHTCGVCGKSYFDNNKFNYPYCPNCGAKMDGERREE